MSLYKKILPVHYSCRQEFRKKKTLITFNVSVESPGNSALSKQVVCHLTKEDEPLFLYVLKVSEEDFHTLKTQQNLLIDFANFPQKFVDLLESVLAEDGKSDPKFLLYFIENLEELINNSSSPAGGYSFLEIVESNPFKHLVHLSLKFVRADDKQLQKYLSDTIVSLKKREQETKKQARSVENDLNRKLQAKEESLLKQTQDFDVANNQHSLTLNKVKEDFDKEKRCLEEKLKESQFEIQCLKQENQQIVQLKEDLKILKLNENKLQRELIDCEKIRNQLETQLQTVEKDLDDKDADLQRAEDRYQVLLDQKRKLEQKCDKLKQLEVCYKDQCGETEKGVQIIKKFQSDLIHCRKEASTLKLIAKEQEKVIKSKETTLTKLASEVESLAKDIASHREEKNKLVEKCDKVEKENLELKKQLETKTNLINFLNKQVGENHLRPISNPPVPYSSNNRLNYKPVLGMSSLQNDHVQNEK